MATDMTVANTILAQLGGTRFIAITGARYLTATDNSLSMQVPNAKCNGQRVTGVMIRLDPSDTYTVEVVFVRVRPTFDRKVIDSRSDVYAENLRGVFTLLTGLVTTL